MKLLHDWEGKTQAEVFKDFDGTRWDYYREDDSAPVEEKPKFAGFEVLFGSYSYENYSGDAFVLARKEGKLYEVNGGHCSCSGLEGQWEPEETTVEALMKRLKEGNLGHNDWCGNEFAAELEVLLTKLEP